VRTQTGDLLNRAGWYGLESPGRQGLGVHGSGPLPAKKTVATDPAKGVEGSPTGLGSFESISRETGEKERWSAPLGQPARGPGVPTGQLLGTFAYAGDGSASYGVSDEGKAKTSVKNEKMLKLVFMVGGVV